MTKDNKTKISDVANFLAKEGFLLEMETAELLKKYGYKVWVNQSFLDLEEDKKREIDIIAKKEINKILVFLIIECKQSFRDDWLFVCSEKKPRRFYYAVKHFPKIYNLKKVKIFDNLHIFNQDIPLAQNYLTFAKKKYIKSDVKQIKECLFKLPKALIYVASQVDKSVKNIFFPIGLFNQQMFTASYNKKLVVKEKSLIQYSINFESKFYKHKKSGFIGLNKMLESSFYDYDIEKTPEENEINSIIRTAELLGNRFQIDFSAKKSFGKYLNMIEKQIKEISTKKWSFNIKDNRKKHKLL